MYNFAVADDSVAVKYQRFHSKLQVFHKDISRNFVKGNTFDSHNYPLFVMGFSMFNVIFSIILVDTSFSTNC